MAVQYTNEEMTDMLLVFGYCQGNCLESCRVYSERFPNRRLPNRKTFAAVERRIRETGMFAPVSANYGRARTVRTPEVEEEILNRIEENPKLSSRRLGLELGVSKDTVNRVTREQLLHPFHIQRVQDLLPHDFESRLGFCRFIQEHRNQDRNFTRRILFTDEACFTRSGITNLHNEHVYADENPHATKVTHYQHELRINVWAGIIDTFIIGHVILPPRLNGENYLAHLQNVLPDLLDPLPLEVRRGMWFMHDGATPHFTLNVRNYLNEQYPNRWLGRGNDAPAHWPARSPDMTPMDYFLWGTLKSLVYSRPVDTEDELRRRIQTGIDALRNDDEMLQRVQFNFLRRINLCTHENGGHFEHLLKAFIFN